MTSIRHALPGYNDLEEIIVSEAMIKRRVRKLGTEITAAFGGEEVTVVAIINGAMFFVADLLREVPLSRPPRLHPGVELPQ